MTWLPRPARVAFEPLVPLHVSKLLATVVLSFFPLPGVVRQPASPGFIARLEHLVRSIRVAAIFARTR